MEDAGRNAQVKRKRPCVENPSSESATAAAGTESQDAGEFPWSDYAYKEVRYDVLEGGRIVRKIRWELIDPPCDEIPPEGGCKIGPNEDSFTKCPFYQAAVAAGVKVEGKGRFWTAKKIQGMSAKTFLGIS